MKQKQKRRIFFASFLGVILFSFTSTAVFAATPPSLGGAQSGTLEADFDKAFQDRVNQENAKTPPAASTAAPSSALESGGYSGLIPCGRSGAQGEASEPCTACHAVVGAKRLMDYITGIMVIVAIAVIVAMGILYILSGVNTELVKKAKAGLKAVFFGLVFMLSAWLIVSTILRFMANDNFVQGGGGFIGLMPGDGVYGLQCSTRSSARSATVIGGKVINNQGGTVTGGGNTGTCSAATAGPCSPQSLSNTCFGGPNVNTWSAICLKESSNSATIASGTDKCTGDGSVVSFGLFQINISANRVAGLDCPSAFSSMFTGSNKNCRVINRELYNRCVTAAKNAQHNINTACALAGANATNTGPWGAARACKISRSL